MEYWSAKLHSIPWVIQTEDRPAIYEVVFYANNMYFAPNDELFLGPATHTIRLAVSGQEAASRGREAEVAQGFARGSSEHHDCLLEPVVVDDVVVAL